LEPILGAAFFAGVLLFFAYQVYWGVTAGVLQPITRRTSGWVSYQSHPVEFVFSLIVFSLFSLILFAGFFLVFYNWLFGRQWYDKLQRRPPLDDAIRQAPEDR